MDAVFISCGALCSLDIVDQLELRFGKPVICSKQAMMLLCLRLAGTNDQIYGYGTIGGVLRVSETSNASEVIQTAILERICFLEYRAGDRLKEADLAAEFGVSRTPIRDALSRIQHLELIETRNGVGTVVIELSDQKITDVYEMRLKLASMIGEMSTVEITGHHKTQLAGLLAQAQKLQSDFRSRDYVVLNHALHQLICELISNSLLRSFWRQTYYQAASVWYRIADVAGPEFVHALVEELGDLALALEHGDLNAVGYIQRTHIGYGFARIKRCLFDTP